ncbi:MAG: NAD(P)-binding domain-containing protein, partial [Helicobacter sp.]|nr:NAD(P)-binding domain-containing protein [Helicobacter sp.]
MNLRTQSTKQAKLVCVGYGNMARAILEGLIKSKAFQKYEILIVGRDLSSRSPCPRAALRPENPKDVASVEVGGSSKRR